MQQSVICTLAAQAIDATSSAESATSEISEIYSSCHLYTVLLFPHGMAR